MDPYVRDAGGVDLAATPSAELPPDWRPAVDLVRAHLLPVLGVGQPAS